MNDANKETNVAYEEPKKKVHIKLLIFLALIAALVICWGLKIVTFYYKTHGIWGYYFIRAVMRRSSTNCQRVSLTRISQMR